MAQTLGKRLKEFRLSRGWSQGRLALYLGVSRATVVRMERGEKVSDLTRAKIERVPVETAVA